MAVCWRWPKFIPRIAFGFPVQAILRSLHVATSLSIARRQALGFDSLQGATPHQNTLSFSLRAFCDGTLLSSLEPSRSSSQSTRLLMQLQIRYPGYRSILFLEAFLTQTWYYLSVCLVDRDADTYEIPQSPLLFPLMDQFARTLA